MSKVGRNDPCPCGSGKKYKQCCALKQHPGAKRKFKATVISQGSKDLVEHAFGSILKAQKDTPQFVPPPGAMSPSIPPEPEQIPPISDSEKGEKVEGQ